MSQSMKWKIAQGLEIKWWRRYLKDKDVGEYLAWKRDYWRGFLRQINIHIREFDNARVLDAGCGPAGIFILLEDADVTAIDPLLDRYNAEIDHFSLEKYPGIVFKNTTLEAFHADEKFNYIFCLNALNHVSDIEKATANLMHHLAPGGQLILSIDCHKYNPLKHLFRLIPGDALHPHQMSLGDYKDLVVKCGGAVKEEVKLKGGRIFDYWAVLVN